MNTFFDFDLKRLDGADDLLGPIFDEVANVDWNAHLPLMYDFWDSVLFSTGRYHGNPLEAHRAVANLTPLGDRAFFRWLTLFEATVDDLFAGDVADKAKQSARRIAGALQQYLSNQGASPLTFGQRYVVRSVRLQPDTIRSA